MKRVLVFLCAMTLVFGFVCGASAVPFGFYNITNNNSGDAAIGEAQLSVDVTAPSLGLELLFTFGNVGPDASSIVQVYFDDGNGTLLASFSIDNSDPGVSFSQGASPPNLPGGNNASPPFDTTAGLLADADSKGGKQINGVNPGETLGILFNLGSAGFDDVIANLSSGGLRIGIHVQGFDSGGSESFVNNPNPIPEPATMLLLGAGLIGLAGLGRKKFVKK